MGLATLHNTDRQECFPASRKTAGHPWKRSEETKGRKLGAKTSSGSSISWQIDRLLTCRQDEIAGVAFRLVDLLEKQEPIHQPILLRALATKIKMSIHGSSQNLANRIAAIEVLSMFNFPSTAELIESSLTCALGDDHLYLIALARSAEYQLAEQCERVAGLIVRTMEEAADNESMQHNWGRLCVEIFRTLSEISPREALGPICRHIESLHEENDLTAVLDAIVVATRKLSNLDWCNELKATSKKLFEHFVTASEDDYTNIPGIVARLLEITGRCEATLKDKLGQIESHPLRADILYLFIGHPITFLPRSERVEWYATGSIILLKSDLFSEFQDMLAVMMQDGDKAVLAKVVPRFAAFVTGVLTN
ncbi:hypothetical protein AB1L88_11665 [Tautonia sp. JC769]|uniref:hypothetical protein n=1 Tax=Tautonia sp. JC769 TaxID=3232135 RepID=UPI0034585CD5